LKKSLAQPELSRKCKVTEGRLRSSVNVMTRLRVGRPTNRG